MGSASADKWLLGMQLPEEPGAGRAGVFNLR